MAPLNPRIRALVKRLAVLGIVTILAAAAQPFLWELVRSGASRVREDRSRIEQIQVLRERVEGAEAEFERQQAFLNQLASVAPGSQETLHVLERLEGAAQRAGAQLTVKGIRDEAASPGETTAQASAGLALLPLVVEVSAAGEAQQLLGFLDGVEHLAELTQVRTVALSPALDAASPLWQMSLTIIFYLQPADEDVS